jgi:hypothetical protein
VHPETTGIVGVVWVEDGVDGGGIYPYFDFFHCDVIVRVLIWFASTSVVLGLGLYNLFSATEFLGAQAVLLFETSTASSTTCSPYYGDDDDDDDDEQAMLPVCIYV